jgi:transposase
MRDVDLYQQALGLTEPWSVSKVELMVAAERVDVWVSHTEDVRWSCPECRKSLPLYDHSEERSWRHLDTMQFKTFLHARPPRVECPEHGVKQVRLPWAEPHSRFTAMFERFAIEVLQQTDIEGATRILRTSWHAAMLLIERAVERGQRAKEKQVVAHLGVDEKAARKGHKYLTLVCDLEKGVVEHVGIDRKEESLSDYFRGLSPEQLEGIKAIAVDMWEPFLNAARKHVPDAEKKLVYDRFHIMSHVGKAVDDVRKQEHRQMRSVGDDTLARTKYLWLYSQENLPERYQERFQELRAINLKTARAWAIKEVLRGLWSYQRRASADRFWKGWFFWATHSRLKPIIDAAYFMKRHLDHVLNFFQNRVTNAVSEGINSKIQTIKKMACGFRNLENFKTVIYFHCGGLQLYPATHGNRR